MDAQAFFGSAGEAVELHTIRHWSLLRFVALVVPSGVKLTLSNSIDSLFDSLPTCLKKRVFPSVSAVDQHTPFVIDSLLTVSTG